MKEFESPDISSEAKRATLKFEREEDLRAWDDIDRKNSMSGGGRLVPVLGIITVLTTADFFVNPQHLDQVKTIINTLLDGS